MGLGSLTVPCPMSKKRRMKEKRKGNNLVEERRADVRTMLWMWVRRVAGPGWWSSPASPVSVFSMG